MRASISRLALRYLGATTALLLASSAVHGDDCGLLGCNHLDLGNFYSPSLPRINPTQTPKLVPMQKQEIPIESSGATIGVMMDRNRLQDLYAERDRRKHWAAGKLIEVSVNGLFLVFTGAWGDPNGWDPGAEDNLREARENGQALADINAEICDLRARLEKRIAGLCPGTKLKVVNTRSFEVNPSAGTYHQPMTTPPYNPAPSSPGCFDSDDSSIGRVCPTR